MHKIRIRLREILEERGISQRQFAISMNMRIATINHLCSNSVDRVYTRTLEQICEALNITVDQLIVSASEDSPDNG